VRKSSRSRQDGQQKRREGLRRIQRGGRSETKRQASDYHPDVAHLPQKLDEHHQPAKRGDGSLGLLQFHFLPAPKRGKFRRHCFVLLRDSFIQLKLNRVTTKQRPLNSVFWLIRGCFLWLRPRLMLQRPPAMRPYLGWKARLPSNRISRWFYTFAPVTPGTSATALDAGTLGLTTAHEPGQTTASGGSRCSSTVVKCVPRSEMSEVAAGRSQRPSRRAAKPIDCRMIRATDECDDEPNSHRVMAWTVRKPMQRDRSSNLL